jgi:hypothetical protein
MNIIRTYDLLLAIGLWVAGSFIIRAGHDGLAYLFYSAGVLQLVRVGVPNFGVRQQ